MPSPYTHIMRGKPKLTDKVHLAYDFKRRFSSGTRTDTFCLNGAWHCWMTYDHAEVTCPTCLAKIAQRRKAGHHV